MTAEMLIAGVGNIFLGDDGFGPEVARQLTRQRLPGWAHVVDYGIRGMHLAYDLASGYRSAILVDATPRGGAPGTIYLIEPDLSQAPGPAGSGDVLAAGPMFNAHGMQPDVVFGMLGMLDAADVRVLVVGCEPASVEYGIGLTEPVAGAVDEAVRIVRDLVADAARSDEHCLAMRERANVPRDSR